jgi:putative YhbY family RNA-binding protein
MTSLASTVRRALRAKAHHLNPFVSVGHHGLTPAVLHEIDVALLAHELIKIRVFSDERSERVSILARICEELDAAPVQHLGKMLIVWRPAPKDDASASPAAGNAGKSAAKRAPQVRHPRNPVPRTPPRPGLPAPRGKSPKSTPSAPKSRRGKPAAKRAPPPHGKSASSSVGASGARRRRKAR